jgi:uncharacterized repeat protein (TIGR03803 family)
MALMAQIRKGSWPRGGTVTCTEQATPGGGTNGYGVVFKITPDGRLKVLYNFDGVHGSGPNGGLTLGRDGNFYGTTGGGGADKYGTIFKITKSGSLTTLYNFTDGADGSNPDAPPIQGTDGNLYGTTSGTAYKITPSGTFTPLGSLPGQSYAPLLQATDLTFYGTTIDGGPHKCYWYGTCGTVFRMTPKGIVRVLHNFGGEDGDSPEAPVIQGSEGNFYGDTAYGGNNDGGVVFKLTPHGGITVLHNFAGPPNDVWTPAAGLLPATDGNFYGVTVYGGTGPCGDFGCGGIFQIAPTGDVYSVLYNFDITHGEFPYTTPMQHTNGKIYGLTSEGGTWGDGVFYSLDMGLGPFVSLVSTSGKVGKTVEVLGQGFTGTTAVSFNGTAATFKVWSDTFLKATVPSGATTGFVTVTTPGAKLTSSKEFRVKP